MTRLMDRSEAKNGVKSAWKLLVAAIGGGEATSACTRATNSLISNYGNRDSERFVPADIIIDAEAIAGEPLVTRALARAQGYRLVKVAFEGNGVLAAELSRIGADVADLLSVAAHHLGGRTLDPADRARMIRSLEDLAQVVGETIHTVQAEPVKMARHS